MPLLDHHAPIIILPADTAADDASALATVLDQHGARRILQLTRAALQFTSMTTPTTPAPAPVGKDKPTSKTRGRPMVKPKAPPPDECNGITRAGLPCRRGPRCKMHLSPATEPQPSATPTVPDNAPETPATDADEPSEPEPPQPAPEPISELQRVKKQTRRCPHCQADAAMMETMRLPGNFTEVRCHACGYRVPTNLPNPVAA